MSMFGIILGVALIICAFVIGPVGSFGCFLALIAGVVSICIGASEAREKARK